MPSVNFEYATYNGIKIAILKVGGDFDRTCNRELWETLDNLIISEKIIYILIDCDKLTYLSSSGMGVILKGMDLINAQNGKLALMNLKDNLYSTFRLTGLLEIIPVVKSPEDFVDSL